MFIQLAHRNDYKSVTKNHPIKKKKTTKNETYLYQYELRKKLTTRQYKSKDTGTLIKQGKKK